jgi:HD-GYP domain-containing protein (c-di-GMP phosphodiesterase class II)
VYGDNSQSFSEDTFEGQPPHMLTTLSGSFDLRDVAASSVSTLVNALPTPALLVDEAYSIILANESFTRIARERKELAGSPFYQFFPHPKNFFKVKRSMMKAWQDRQIVTADLTLQIGGNNVWGRAHFQSLRLVPDLAERLLLVLLVDFTTEKKQLIAKHRREKELRQVQGQLEQRIVEHTEDLSRSIERLKKEVARRKEMETKLRGSRAKLAKTLEGTIKALSGMSERKDPYVGGHQRRVAKLARAMGRAMDLPRDQVMGITIAAHLHDIGKIVVPGELLSKPGDISEHEYAILKTHCEVGCDTLTDIESPWPLAQVVLQHHERINGTGYPQRLEGEDILLEARIIGVADVVEAMSSHRPYRPALGTTRALEEIHAGRGTLFDADVVDACFSVFNQGFGFRQPVTGT